MDLSYKDVLQKLLRVAENNFCEHEDIYRGGTNWTICSSCGRKWADDEGGMPENKYPDEIIKARDFLDKKKKCVIRNRPLSFILEVDNKQIGFSGSYNADYFKDHYRDLGYEIELVDEYE